ncbi:MAG: hypothetical protein IKU61_03720 [Clostridia bacterium]|nr:hypothetical protein [Clostridia bacterium]
MRNVVLENKHFRLTLGEDCIAQSLILKSTDEECLADEKLPLFSLTEERPFNNEIKLAYPNKQTVFSANRVRREGNKLIVGFELVSFEAVVDIEEKDEYISFKLSDFIVPDKAFEGLKMDVPPVSEFRLLQLPVKNRDNFGQWLNVIWDENAAVNVLAACPHARIDAEKRNGYSIMSADALRGIKLKGCVAALIASSRDCLFDCIDALENDYNLPRGVESRRASNINSSALWTASLNPSNVDAHIEYAKLGGFKKILVYYSAFFIDRGPWYYSGDYDYRDTYPNGAEDLKAVIAKLNAAGIKAGIHFLQTFVGIRSRYVTPIADHRLGIKEYYTLSKPISKSDDVIFVEQNPEWAPMQEDCRVLKFDGEIIQYESFSIEYPYCFKGCKRGHFDTLITEHSLGTIGGVVDVCEYEAHSIYADQRTSLPDELATKLADAYNCGFEFVYFDGSEGTRPPYEFNIPFAQYRVYKKFINKPIFCQCAAKAHFSWHMMSGGNAFDIFPMSVFKEKIVQFPAEEATRMKSDFTTVDFGWWKYDNDTQADIYEYGTSKAAAYDCPVSVQFKLEHVEKNPRTSDIYEVMRRWEDVREKNWLTDEQKEALKNPDTEYTLLIDENGEYELVPYVRINSPEDVSAFCFERCGKTYVTLWHKSGEAKLKLKLDAESLVYEAVLGGKKLSVENIGGDAVISVSNKCYLSTTLDKETVLTAFEKAELI